MITLVLAAPHVASAQADSTTLGGTDRARRDAIALLQGEDSLPFLDTARISLVATALRAIREQLPDVRDIDTGPDRSFLVAYMTDSGSRIVLARSEVKRPSRGARHRAESAADTLVWQARIEQIGVPELDRLRKKFDVRSTVLHYQFGQVQLEMFPRRPLNVPVAAAEFQRSPLVDYAGAQIYLGEGSWIRMVPKGTQLHFIFALGSGDCPSGCIHWEYHYVAYDTASHEVRVEREAPKPGA